MLRFICKPGDAICEIGVFQGAFAQFLYSLMPRALVLIDPFEGIVSSGNEDGNCVVHADLNKVYDELAKKCAPLKNIQLRRGYSQDVLPQYPDSVFDVMYIDGNHSYEGVKSDLEFAIRKVRPGGFICFHDYMMNHTKTVHTYDFGVKQAVDEFCAKYGLEIWAFGLDGCVSGAIQKPYSEPTPSSSSDSSSSSH